MFINRMIFLSLNIKEIKRIIKKAVYIPSTQVEAVFEENVVWPMSKVMIKPCNERLMT